MGLLRYARFVHNYVKNLLTGKKCAFILTSRWRGISYSSNIQIRH